MHMSSYVVYVYIYIYIYIRRPFVRRGGAKGLRSVASSGRGAHPPELGKLKKSRAFGLEVGFSHTVWLKREP